MEAHSASYEERISSDAWRRLRARRIRQARGRCEWCGWLADRLELHHKTYERLGHERDSDLELLCPDCHRKADVQRAARTATRRYWSRVRGFARAKYGEDCEDWLDPADVAEEFEAWVDE